MWKVYLVNNYIFIENGTIQHRRLKTELEIRKRSQGSTFYSFHDNESIFFQADVSKLEDADSNAFTTETFDDFITANTGL